MAILKQSTFSLVLLALISSTAYGSIKFMNCNIDEGDTPEDVRSGKGKDFQNNREGNQRTTYGNLCAYTDGFDDTQNTSNEIESRVGWPFSRFCDIIDRWENVQNLMFRGSAPHTVFAPTDAAFAKIDGLIDRVNELRLLELHILPQARLTQDLRCGQTYRTINTLQDRRNNQRSKTRCVNAAVSQQLGPGNTINGLRPTIGEPPNVFRRNEFQSQDDFVLSVNSDEQDANDQETFSQNVVSCNGVIHVVDEVLLPGNVNDFSLAGVPVPYNPYNSVYYNSYNEPHSHNDYYGGLPAYYNGPTVAYTGYTTYYNSGYYRFPKKSKGGKGFKGAKGYGYYGARRRRRPPAPGYYFRNLKAGEKADADEKPMSDAEFFGTEGLANIEAKIESVKDELSEKPDENRKRRLEAMLEADGSVKV